MNFFWSPFPTKRSTKNPQTIRGKFGAKFGAKSGTKSRKFGELSFCNFSDLKFNVNLFSATTIRGHFIHPYPPPPTPENTLLGVGGCIKGAGGRIKFLARGASRYTLPPPSPQKCLLARNGGRGEEGAYIIAPWIPKKCLFSGARGRGFVEGGFFAKIYASLGCGALSAKCTAGSKLFWVFLFSST